MRRNRNFGSQIAQVFHWEIPQKVKICKIIIFISVVSISSFTFRWPDAEVHELGRVVLVITHWQTIQ